MPSYQYRCRECGTEKELDEPSRDDLLCLPDCGSRPVRVYSFGISQVQGAGGSPSRRVNGDASGAA